MKNLFFAIFISMVCSGIAQAEESVLAKCQANKNTSSQIDFEIYTTLRATKTTAGHVSLSYTCEKVNLYKNDPPMTSVLEWKCIEVDGREVVQIGHTEVLGWKYRTIEIQNANEPSKSSVCEN